MELTNEFNKLSNETIIYLGIKNTYFVLPEGITSIIKPINITSEKWTILSSMDLPKEGSIVIQLKDGRESRINCSAHKDNNSEYYNSYILELTSEVDKEIIKKLEKFKLLSSESEKRAGARFNIGLENWKSFGLNTPEVLLYLNKKSYKCIIENVSCSGVLLTGESSPIQQSDVGISFVCGFKNPRINVIQKAMVVRCQMLKKAYAKYSLHFLDPVSLTWLERILKYAEAQE